MLNKILESLLDGYIMDENGTNIVHRDKRKSRKPMQAELYLRYQDIPDAPDVSLKNFVIEAKKIFTARAEQASASVANFTAFEDSEDLVRAGLEHFGVRLDRSGRDITILGKSSSLAEVRPLLEKYTEDYNRAIPVDPESGKLVARGFKVSHVRATLETVLIEKELESLSHLQNKIAHKNNALFNLDEELAELLDILGIDGDEELFIAGFKHWLWSIKRYIFGKPVVYHLMLSIFGGQGKGKSYFVRNLLCAPIADFYAESSLDTITDNREVSKWTKFFVVNFEELSANREDSRAGVSAQVVTAFKRLLTQDRIVTREMHSHRQRDERRTFSAIATTNVKLSARLGDSSGMRRFLEMESNVPAEENYKDRGINELDFLSIWRAIDENLPEGYLHPGERVLYDRLQDLQATYIPADTIDYYLHYSEEIPLPAVEADKMSDEEISRLEAVSPRDIYSDYRRFCIESGYTSLSLARFKERLLTKSVFYREPRVGRVVLYLWEQPRQEGK